MTDDARQALEIPDGSLVAVIDPAGAGAAAMLEPHAQHGILRGAALGDVLASVRQRLDGAVLTIVEASRFPREDRQALARLAKQHHLQRVAVAVDGPQGEERPRLTEDGLRSEGFRRVHLLRPDALGDVKVRVTPPDFDRRSEHGPFDLIGDVHGCFDELRTLLEALGHAIEQPGDGGRFRVTPAPGRTLVFLGDLVDRGPNVTGVLRLVMDACDDGVARCVIGNHELKLALHLEGRRVRVAHGLAETLRQLDAEPAELTERVRAFIAALPSHLLLDEGRLVAAHAGLPRELQGRTSGRVREFALYGDTTGEIDELGLPIRRDWAQRYDGDAAVVYGHTPIAEPQWVNGAICIDTGCVFGGRLTALRYPERELVSVPATATHWTVRRPRR